MAQREQAARSLLRAGLLAARQPGAAGSASQGASRCSGAPAWPTAAARGAGAAAPVGRACGRAWPRGLFTSAAASSSGQAAAAAAAAAAAGEAAAGEAAAALARPRSLPRRLRGLLRDYKQLSKARLSALVVLTASAGYVAGSDGPVDWAGLGWTSLGTFGAAAAANALNQAYEAANDALMNRTRGRPLPAGRMGRAHAVAFAAVAGAAGLWILAEKANLLTAALGAANIILYAGVYTPLKQLTWANTWVGAVVGAIPPLMGWAAAAGELEPASAVLAAALFFWQMPHFLSLAWLCREDYARGGFKMLSMYDPTGRRTAAAALRHCAYLLPVGAAAVALGVASPWFGAEASVLAAGMGAGAVAFYRAPSQASARKLFRGSLVYLPLLLAALAVHRQPNAHVDAAEARRRLERQWDAAKARLRPLRDAASGAVRDAPRLRTVEERLGWIEAVRWQVRNSVDLKCPSRVYADKAGSSDSSGSDGSSDGGSSSSSSSSSGDSRSSA